MSTTGKRYIKRTQDRSADRLLDGRTKAILNAVLKERPGKAVTGYLLANGIASGR